MLSKRHHKCYERLKKEESIFTADHENLLLDPGLGRKSRILTQKKKKKGRQNIMVWKFIFTDFGRTERSSIRERRS